MFLHLFRSLVRPHLVYGSVIFSPTLEKDQIMLENVQRRATRLVKALQGKTYPERLKRLGLPSLQYRRLRNDMVQTYKIIRDIDIVDKDKLLPIVTDTRTRGHKYKLFKRRSILNIRKNVFSNRVVDTWNNLPGSVVESPSVNSFKSRLNRHWTNHPSQFNPPCYIPLATRQIVRYSQQRSNAPQEAEMA